MFDVQEQDKRFREVIVRKAAVVVFVAGTVACASVTAGPAVADAHGQPDLTVEVYCGGELPGHGAGIPMQAVIHNVGSAPAYDVAVDYWSLGGPSGTRTEPVLEPGEIGGGRIGEARTLELMTARVHSNTPESDVTNNVRVEPLLCLSAA